MKRIISIALFGVLWFIPMNDPNLKGACENPQIYSQVRQKCGYPGGPGTCGWHLKWGQPCRTEPLNVWGLLYLPGVTVRTRPTCGTPGAIQELLLDDMASNLITSFPIKAIGAQRQSTHCYPIGLPTMHTSLP